MFYDMGKGIERVIAFLLIIGLLSTVFGSCYGFYWLITHVDVIIK
jgi:hypothetical protein